MEVLILGALVAFAAAVIDVRTTRIPNGLTYPAIITGLALALALNGWDGLLDGLLGLAVGFVPALLLFVGGGIGGGDVKLLAAMGAIFGYPVIMDVLFYSIIAGVVYGLVVIVWHGRVLETLRGFGVMLRSVLYPGVESSVPVTDLRIPFAVAVALGVGSTFLLPWIRVSLYS